MNIFNLLLAHKPHMAAVGGQFSRFSRQKQEAEARSTFIQIFVQTEIRTDKHGKLLYRWAQWARMDLNKRSGPKQKTITASKGTP